MKECRNIGVFDSGIGGVTVLKEIIKVLPQNNYIYYSDSKNNPYGDKTESEIIAICDNIVQVLLKQNCKIIVIACNTASAQAANHLRKRYSNIPFIAIEPAYKMVYDYAYNEPTLVMATKGTLQSEKFNLLYNKYNNYNTILLPCVGLADIIEEEKKEEIQEYLKKHIQCYRGKIKNVVLGCTHYTLIQKEILQTLGDVNIFNGAEGVALKLKETLEKNGIQADGNKIIKFIDSQMLENKKQNFFKILNQKE